ncbi:MAG TPA: type II toxin-antitoxin system VapC family toxin, partial [archaeon]|nr:type II toxin-antitoxin system VapC family toxin [archaeon]
MYLIDTNVFLELLLGRKKAEECEKLFNALEEKRMSAIATHYSIYSICLYCARNNMAGAAKTFLKYLAGLENLEVINTTVEDDIKIIGTMAETGLDFDDSLQHYTAKETDCK